MACLTIVVRRLIHITLAILIPASFVVAQCGTGHHVALDFSQNPVLPSSAGQGLTFTSSGPAEASVFSVSGGLLHMNSLGTGALAGYFLPNGFTSGFDLSVEVNAHVFPGTGVAGFDMEINDSVHTLTFYVTDSGVYLPDNGFEFVPLTTTDAFHDYQLRSDHSHGTWSFSVDNNTVKTGNISQPPAGYIGFFFGDGTLSADGRVDIASLRFDNPPCCQVSVTPVSQGNPLWNPPFDTQPYDYLTNPPVNLPNGAKAWYIEKSGCALTSLAMALQFAGATSIPVPVPQPLDPGTLNQFMENYGAYTSGNTVKDTGNIDFPLAVALVGTANGLPLKFDPTSTPDSTSLGDLDALLCAAKPHPVIVQVGQMNGKTTPCQVLGQYTGHYVLVTGKQIDSNGTHYLINDPGCSSFTTLDAYGNKFKIRGIVRDPTDVSTLNIFVENTADLLVTDASGNSTGSDPATGTILHQIPGSGHFVDLIDSDTTSEPALGQTYSVQILQPVQSTYAIQVTGLQLGTYTLAVDAISQDGTVQPRVVYEGISAPGSTANLGLQFLSAPGSTSTVTVTATFQTTLADISNSLALGLIKDRIAAKVLSGIIDGASAAAGRGDTKWEKTLLNAFKEIVNLLASQRGKHLITGTAPEILISDANSLLAQIQ